MTLRRGSAAVLWYFKMSVAVLWGENRLMANRGTGSEDTHGAGKPTNADTGPPPRRRLMRRGSLRVGERVSALQVDVLGD